MKYLIYTILISGFVGFVTYATIETNKTINQKPDQNASAVFDTNTNNNLTAIPIDSPISNIDGATTINNTLKKSPTKIRYEDNEREDD